MSTMAAAAISTPECTHEHCVQCIRTSCKYNKFIVPAATAANACSLMQCHQMCGATYHSCKDSEHRELCAYERVPCINAVYGCPVMLMRWTRGQHLSRCPASVVYCTMQWNRWPVFSAERQVRVPFSQNNFHARYGQLDVALALRDQRVLTEGRKAPHSTRRVLRNRLTERFPAVPLPLKRSSYREHESLVPESPEDGCSTNHIDLFTDSSTDQDQVNDLHHDRSDQRYTRARSKGRCSSSMDTISDDDESYSDAPWMTNKDPPGLCRSILQQLMKPLNGAAVTSSSHAGNDVDLSNDVVIESNLGNGAGDVDSGNDVAIVMHGQREPEYVPSDDASADMKCGDASCEIMSRDSIVAKDCSAVEASCLNTSAIEMEESNKAISFIASPNTGAVVNKETGLNTLASGDEVETNDVFSATTSSSNGLTEKNEAIDFIISVTDAEGYHRTGECEILEYNGDEIAEYLAMHDVAKLPISKAPENCTTVVDNIAPASDNITTAVENSFADSDNFTTAVYNSTSTANNCTTVADNCISAANNCIPAADNCSLAACNCTSAANNCIPAADNCIPGVGTCTLAANSQNPPPSPPYCFPLDPLFTPPFTNCNPLSPTSNFRLPIALQHILALDLNIESIAPYCAKPRSMYTFICAQPFRRDEYASHFGNVHGDIHSGLNGWMEARCPLALYGCTYSVLRLNPQGGAVRFSSVLDSFGFKPTLSQCATSGADFDDLSTLGCCNNGGFKSVAVENGSYTTVDIAGSNLRHEDQPENDDFTVTSACNEHPLLKTDKSQSVINDSQNSSMQIECPQDHISSSSLMDAPLMNVTQSVRNTHCPHETSTYAEFKRNKPRHKEPTPEIYTSKGYDSAVSVEKARIQPVFRKPYHEYIVEQTPPRDEDTLSQLPFEILQYVGRCLDSFSLCNLALTSHYLRDVCRSLVERRGIVIQEWEKVPRKMGDDYSWVVTYQRWLFSTAFTPIDNWHINKTACISNHLKTCPYFIKAEPKEQPIGLLGLCADLVVKQDNEGNDSTAQFYPHVVPNRPGYQTAHGKFAEVMTELARHLMLDDSDSEPTPAEEGMEEF